MVVLMMTGGDDVQAMVVAERIQEAVARATGLGLQAARPRRAQLQAGFGEGYAEAGAERTAESEILGAFFPQAVIGMSREQTQVQALAQPREQVEQHDAVCATGQGDDDALAAARAALGRLESQEGLDQIGL